MKPLPEKRALTVRSALALLLCLISATAILFFYLTPPKTGDGKCDALLSAAIPRFFISVFLLVLTVEYFSDRLAFRRIPCKHLLWCALPLLVAIVNFPFSALIGGTAHVTRTDLIWLFILKCILIGLSEELLFRGIVFCSLLEYFEKKKRSCFLPVLLNSVIFALFHFINLLDGAGFLAVLQQAGYSFLIGAMLSVVLLKTKSLWLSVFLHALFDFGGLFLSDVGVGNPHDLIFWILTVVIGVLCAAQITVTLIRMIYGNNRTACRSKRFKSRES